MIYHTLSGGGGVSANITLANSKVLSNPLFDVRFRSCYQQQHMGGEPRKISRSLRVVAIKTDELKYKNMLNFR